MPRPILALVLGVSAAQLAFVAAATAAFHSPAFAGNYQCPQGSSVRVSQYYASWNQPGETGISIACLDAQGLVQESADQETRGFWALWAIYFLPALAALLIMAGLVAAVRRRRAPPAPPLGIVPVG